MSQIQLSRKEKRLKLKSSKKNSVQKKDCCKVFDMNYFEELVLNELYSHKHAEKSFTNSKNSSQVWDYEWRYKEYIKEEFTMKINVYINRIILESKSLPQKIAAISRLHQMLIKVVQTIMLNEIEVVYFSIFLDELGWVSKGYSLYDNLLMIGLYVKKNLGDELSFTIIKNNLASHDNNFPEKFHNWLEIKYNNKVHIEIQGKIVSQRYTELNRVYNVFCENNFIDHNRIVDQILLCSVPYVGKDERKLYPNWEQIKLLNIPIFKTMKVSLDPITKTNTSSTLSEPDPGERKMNAVKEKEKKIAMADQNFKEEYATLVDDPDQKEPHLITQNQIPQSNYFKNLTVMTPMCAHLQSNRAELSIASNEEKEEVKIIRPEPKLAKLGSVPLPIMESDFPNFLSYPLPVKEKPKFIHKVMSNPQSYRYINGNGNIFSDACPIQRERSFQFPPTNASWYGAPQSFQRGSQPNISNFPQVSKYFPQYQVGLFLNTIPSQRISNELAETLCSTKMRNQYRLCELQKTLEQSIESKILQIKNTSSSNYK